MRRYGIKKGNVRPRKAKQGQDKARHSEAKARQSKANAKQGKGVFFGEAPFRGV